ncbi:MAG: CHAT domain-containing protein [Planctomycetales bacterium]|nr:CHAT domain-containing protein [Planctomycetales bacterium]
MAAQSSHVRLCPRRPSLRLRAAALVAGSCVLLLAPSGRAQQAPVREYPPGEYYLALNIYQAGEFTDAARAFRSAARSGVRSSEGRWVDSICYHTMLGESMYQMGELSQAADEYTAALNLFLVHRNWMLRVDFPDVLQPDQGSARRAPTWGVSTRRSVPARFPDRYPILQGRLDNQQVLQQGGIVALPEFYQVNVHEIMRCTALAIRRRHEIMGRAAAHDPLTTQLVQVLTVRPAPPNHWSGAWIDALLGLAYASAGRSQEAASELGKSLVMASQFDHPLTATSLLALGKLAFEQDQYGTASGLFLEASLSAAWYSQYALVEEALRWGAVTHLVAGQNGMYPPLEPATAWARRESDLLETSLVVSAAEVAATANETATAVTLLEQARRTMARADMRGGTIGARYQYVLALASYTAGNVKAGDAAFAALMAYQRKSSLRLFELGLIDRLVVSAAVTERVGNELYNYALREPEPKDWAVDPVETLSVVLTPHLAPLEHWFEITLKRKEEERAIEISDRIRRHRFFTTLPMGGRLVALRWVLEAPKEAISERALLQRQDLNARYPKYATLARQASALRTQLEGLPLVPAEDEVRQTQKKLSGQLAQISSAQEVLLREIALRRVPADFVFPPPLDLKSFQANLPPGTMVMSYLSTSRAVHAFSFGKDDYKLAALEGGAKLQKRISDVLRSMGHYDKNQPIDLEVLANDAWKEPARAMFAAITNNATAANFDGVNELIIVPDGPLWYLPFEALQIGTAESSMPLITKTRIRYAPTIALAQHDRRPMATTDTKTGAVVGSLFPRDDEKIGLAAFAELQSSLSEVVRLKEPLSVPSNMLATLCDRLVVLSDVQSDGPTPYAWSPMQLDQGKPGSTLGDWAMLPFGSPEQIILPGFHTEAETALKRPAGGEDVFLSLCGLMASGSRTILLSRWRTGGKTSYDLTREFVQELPYTSPTEAWQRSVFLAMQSELVVAREPRVKTSDFDARIKADHPFFWSSYLLVAPGEMNATPPTPNEVAAEKKK